MRATIAHNRIRLFHSIVAICMIAMVLCTILPEASAAELKGSCGTGVTWELIDGTLKISGKGAIANYEESRPAPWYEHRSKIIAVTIDDKVTSIGNMAFYGLSEVTYVSVPSSVTSIGEMAFAECGSLREITLANGLKTIGRDAFNRCEQLRFLTIPGSVTTIGAQAFYRCSSLMSVTVPSKVTSLGETVFGYCTSLMQVRVEAAISQLPMWAFYGCESLVNIYLAESVKEIGQYAFYSCNQLENAYYQGENIDGSRLEDMIQTDVPSFDGVEKGDASDVEESKTESSETKEDGTVVDTEQEVVDKEGFVVQIETQHTKPPVVDNNGDGVADEEPENDSYDIVIDVTVRDEDSWDELLSVIDKKVNYAERLDDDNTTVNKLLINLHNYSREELSSALLGALAGANAQITVQTDANTSWEIDCETIPKEELEKKYNLKYTLTKNDKPTKAQKKLIGDATSYIIAFEETIPFEVSVQVRLGITYARNVATLCQKPVWRDWERVQSVLVDDYGYATFYLASLDSQTDYLVALNMKGIPDSEVRVPESLSEEYGGLIDGDGTKYVVTGTKSAWGITFMQLTWIVIGVIVGSLVLVGAIVWICYRAANKKSRKGKRAGKNAKKRSVGAEKSRRKERSK